MRRRDFISTAAAGSAAVGATGATGRAATVETGDEGTIPAVVFDSAGSLLDADGEPLTDESVVAVWTAATATTTDADGDGDAVAYPDDAAIPLVAVDGSVVALGGTFVEDETDYRFGNEEFLLNVWDDLVGGGTDLRLNEDAVTDPDSNVDDDDTLTVTGALDRRYDLFDPYPVEDDDVVEEYAGNLAAGGRDACAYEPDGSGPIRVELAGAADADFDLFVTLDGRDPTPADHDRRSWGPTAEESIVLGRGLLPEDGEVGLAVTAYEGSGDYELTVTEHR